MKYYSTNGQAPEADLQKAVVKGLAEDRGLYMPERINTLPKAFFDNIQDMSFQQIAYNVASAFFGDDVDLDALQDIVYDTLAFDCPVVKIKDNIFSLELFHGPTLAFKDVGARFMARLLRYFTQSNQNTQNNLINVLVATSGNVPTLEPSITNVCGAANVIGALVTISCFVGVICLPPLKLLTAPTTWMIEPT